MTTQSNALVELERTQTDVNSLRCRFLVPGNLPLFRDHFPTRPVLPAFVIADIVLREAQATWSALEHWQSMPRLKLLLPIDPNVEVTMELERVERDVRFSLVAHTDKGDEPAATGILRFAPTESED
ncbi:MAG: hypothetical protein ACRBN8_31310 [Nannocystales bacterium]